MMYCRVLQRKLFYAFLAACYRLTWVCAVLIRFLMMHHTSWQESAMIGCLKIAKMIFITWQVLKPKSRTPWVLFAALQPPLGVYERWARERAANIYGTSHDMAL